MNTKYMFGPNFYCGLGSVSFPDEPDTPQGVHEAVSIVGQKNVTPAAMHEALSNLAKDDAKKAVIGNVLSAFTGKDNALWCTLILDEERSYLIMRT